MALKLEGGLRLPDAPQIADVVTATSGKDLGMGRVDRHGKDGLRVRDEALHAVVLRRRIVLNNVCHVWHGLRGH